MAQDNSKLPPGTRKPPHLPYYNYLATADQLSNPDAQLVWRRLCGIIGILENRIDNLEAQIAELRHPTPKGDSP